MAISISTSCVCSSGCRTRSRPGIWCSEITTLLERLKAIRQERAKLNGVQFNQITTPEEDQQNILDLLKVKL